ncbi:hypothetical protein [uncultured Shewanella sp.]|uniref:hypothetical protein n=1 Tax=uncultured Shewanella sp. TaxID=173975 RepID=UPI00261A5F94|nr:hypothetical protein [uncultured Shewanella sp.]
MLLQKLMLSFCLLTCSFAALSQANDKNVSGIWVTQAPIPYLVEHTNAHPFGAPVNHGKQ